MITTILVYTFYPDKGQKAGTSGGTVNLQLENQAAFSIQTVTRSLIIGFASQSRSSSSCARGRLEQNSPYTSNFSFHVMKQSAIVMLPVVAPSRGTVQARTRSAWKPLWTAWSFYNNRHIHTTAAWSRQRFLATTNSKPGFIEQGLTSHQTHYRSYRGRVFTRSNNPTNSVKALKEDRS